MNIVSHLRAVTYGIDEVSNMFYIVEKNVCVNIVPVLQGVNECLKANNKTIYKVYQDEPKKVIVEVK